MYFETNAIHTGQEPDPQTGAVITPVCLSSTFAQESVGVHKGFEYSRTGNPTRKVLEDLLAVLEHGKYGLAFSSGVATMAAVLQSLQKDDHVVVGDDLYGGSYRLFEKVFKQWGLQVTYADVTDLKAFQAAVQNNTKLIWVETPTNPLLKIVDIKGLAQIAKTKNILLAVDNTFASPYFQNPLDLGADIVVHSTTKYISGHSDIIGGALITSNEQVYQQIKFLQNALGAIPGAFDSWLVLRGIKTLAVRMKEHAANALSLAKFLESHSKVNKIYYPGLPSHPQYALAQEQMRGFSGIISLELDTDLKGVDLFFSKLKLFTLAESLGGVESLICHPARMTHGSFPAVEKVRRGIKDSLVRISVGIENIDDIITDLDQALSKL